MGKLFNLDSPFMQFMNRVADLMWLNILFVICCIPVITIGPSLTAMYYITLKMVRNEESYITKGFFKSFRQNFLQATILWIMLLAILAVLFVDWRILIMQSGELPEILRLLLIAAAAVRTGLGLRRGSSGAGADILEGKDGGSGPGPQRAEEADA